MVSERYGVRSFILAFPGIQVEMVSGNKRYGVRSFILAFPGIQVEMVSGNKRDGGCVRQAKLAEFRGFKSPTGKG